LEQELAPPSEKVPIEQLKQDALLVAAISGPYIPAVQLRHELAPCGEKVPAEHLAHDELLLVPARELYVPASQLRHALAPWFENIPTEQLVQEIDPSDENDPAEHTLQESEN